MEITDTQKSPKKNQKGSSDFFCKIIAVQFIACAFLIVLLSLVCKLSPDGFNNIKTKYDGIMAKDLSVSEIWSSVKEVASYVMKPVDINSVQETNVNTAENFENEDKEEPTTQNTEEEKTEESTFFASSRTFSLSLSHADSVQNLMTQARHLALFDFPILIQGESGTQRRTLARAIHNFSRRHHYPFSVLHSPGNDLTEASLLRLLAETNHGTLVLSQVDRFPLAIQDLLVNVLTNVYGNFFSAPETRRFDVRIIAIADDNLYKKVEKGTFLRELFHLLSASELQTVPIRRRREDIPDLLNYFLLQFFHNSDMTCDRVFSEGLLRFLKEYAYPGNIHELYNLSCSLFTRYNSHKLQLSDLPTYLRSRQMADVSLTDLQYQVLSFVSTHPKAGRLAIKNGLADGETFVSEAALRTVLGELSSAGYLIVHRTKGGCEISELGRMVLEK